MILSNLRMNSDTLATSNTPAAPHGASLTNKEVLWTVHVGSEYVWVVWTSSQAGESCDTVHVAAYNLILIYRVAGITAGVQDMFQASGLPAWLLLSVTMSLISHWPQAFCTH